MVLRYLHKSEKISVALFGSRLALRLSLPKHGAQLLLPTLYFGSQMVLAVALRNVLDQGTVVRQEVAGDVNRLCVPNFSVL